MIHETFKCTCYEIVTKRDLCKCRFLAADVLHWGLSGTYVTLSRGQMKKNKKYSYEAFSRLHNLFSTESDSIKS